MEPARRLSDGGAELRGYSLGIVKSIWAGAQDGDPGTVMAERPTRAARAATVARTTTAIKSPGKKSAQGIRQDIAVCA
jgi:hypothetical protein